MTQVDVGSIVPSTRDLLQVLATRRRSTAVVAQIDPGSPAEDAARLHELNVSAFAFAEPGPEMQLAARSTRTVPSLSLALAADRDDFLRARFFGADGVCIDASLDLDEWDKRAKLARQTRMLPLALAVDEAGIDKAIAAGAKVILARAASAEALLALVARVPHRVTVLGAITDADAASLRALAGKVDAALVPAGVHTSPAMAALVTELDP